MCEYCINEEIVTTDNIYNASNDEIIIIKKDKSSRDGNDVEQGSENLQIQLNNDKELAINFVNTNRETKQALLPNTYYTIYILENILQSKDQDYDFSYIEADNKKYIELYSFKTDGGFDKYKEFFSFTNSIASFFGNDTKDTKLELSKEWINKLKKRGLYNRQLNKDLKQNPWKGSCFGMAGFVHLNKIYPQTLNVSTQNESKTISCLYDYSEPYKSNNVVGGLRDNINSIHELQSSKFGKRMSAYSSSIFSNNIEEDQNDNFPGMLKYIWHTVDSYGSDFSRTTNSPIVLTIYYYYDNKFTGHSLIPYRCIKDDDGTYHLWSYDCSNEYSDYISDIKISYDWNTMTFGEHEVVSVACYDIDALNDLYKYEYDSYGLKMNSAENDLSNDNVSLCISTESNFSVSDGNKVIKYKNGKFTGDKNIFLNLDIVGSGEDSDGNSEFMIDLQSNNFIITLEGNTNCSIETPNEFYSVNATNVKEIIYNSSESLKLVGNNIDYSALMALDNKDEEFALLTGENTYNPSFNNTNEGTKYLSNDEKPVNVSYINETDYVDDHEIKDELTSGEIINQNAMIKGDVDGDNIITASDAAFVLQKTLISTFELPIQDKTDDWLKYTDVDADNNIIASDATFILQKALISTFELPAEKKNK